MPDKLDPQWAWDAYKPSKDHPWDAKKAGHLFRRAGFGATHSQLADAVKQGYDKTIDQVLQPDKEKLAAFDLLADKMAADVAATNNEPQMRAWWIFRILQSPYPLQEKVTLFWHNHFATSNAKVANVAYMLGQNQLMRKHALGDFRALLQEMSKDPAMMVWLDTNLSKKGQPNENYARELMELFSLGVGNYTEADIREAARAFTGWEIKDNKFFFNKAQHDAGAKTVFGQKGAFGGADIVKFCLDKPACASFLVAKFYRYFICESRSPEPELLQPLAMRYTKSGFDTGDLVTTMLRSNLFFSKHAYRKRIKSPTDFAAGVVKALEGSVGPVALAEGLDDLGQRLFYPPSVKGWDGGTAWLNSTTLLLRHNLALALTSTEDLRFGRRCDPAALVRRHLGDKADDDAAVVAFFANLFLQGDLPEASRTRLREYLAKAQKNPYPVYWTDTDKADHRLRAVCHLALTLPECQLD